MNDALLSRRQILRRGASAALLGGAAPGLLAACGSSKSGSSASGKVAGNLDFFSYQGYDLPGIKQVAAWKKQHGVRVRASYIGAETEVAAKIEAQHGAKGSPDIITYYEGYKPRYAGLKIIKPIDVERIPNYSSLFPTFSSGLGDFWKDPNGDVTGVPFLWGTTGLTFDSNVAKLSSYDEIFAPRFKGKVGIIDDPQVTFTLAAHVLGFDAAKVTKAQYAQVQDYLLRVLRQTKGVAPNFGDLTSRLVSGDVQVVFTGYKSLALGAAMKGKKSIQTVLPKEGGYGFCDAWAIPVTCDNEATALSWINLALDPLVQAQAAEANVSGATVRPAVAHLNAATKTVVPYADIPSLTEKAPFYDNPPEQSSQYVTFQQMVDGWQDLKGKI